MTDETARKLTPNCREMRATYVSSLETYAKSPVEFEKQIQRALESGRAQSPAYRAILIAAVFGESGLIPSLEMRAQVEASKKPPFSFATAAIERLRTGGCSARFDAPEYEEVCRVSAPAARRLGELARAGKRK